MKPLIPIFSLVVAGLWSAVLPTNAQVNVTREHNNLSRDGLYIDSAFTPSAAANMTRDLNFNGTISGNVYAQPLYIENGPGGAAMVIVVTESNNIYALDAITGTVIWYRNVGAPVTSGLPCGNISPLGITGTPVVDVASRSLFFDAMIDGATKGHFIFSLNVDTGVTNPGWPVNVNAKATYNGMTFTSSIQNERAALGLVNGVVYVPYSGHFGDCGTYHGWVVGVPINNPSSVTAWATTAVGGGIWGHGGVASDGTNMFVITGNTFNTGGTWGGGEAIIRLQAGPIFSGNPTDYWAPANWLSLDNTDTDLGGCGAVLINVPGATPSQLVLALGKDGNAYLLNRNNLGGITAPVGSANVASSVRGQAAATYRTNQGTYFVFRNGSSSVSAYKITATTPPGITSAWSVSQTGQGSPWVTTTNGTNNAIVWVAGAEGDQRLHAYNGDTGAVVYAGGGPNELMTNTRKWNTGIVARGRIYFAADNKVYAFAVPAATPTPTPTPSPTPTATPTPTPTPAIQVTVQTNLSGPSFMVDGTTYTSAQTFSWASGSSHTIATTSPQNGATGVRYVWNSWTPGGAISHTVVPTTNTTYTARFTTQYYLTMSHGVGGTVSPGSGWRNSGAAISIGATPTNNTQVSYTFSGWTGSGTGSYSGTNNPAAITMNGPITETATFTQNPVQVTVQTNPPGRGFTVDGTTYTAAQTFSWVPGSSHTIATTSPQSGATGVRYVWNGWTGGGAISHSVAPTTNKTYTANFTTQYYLTMSHGAGGTVSPGSGWRNSGVTVSITATPSTGYSFSSWAGTGTGSFSGTANPASTTMGGPITEAATFTHN
jgi:uncharacterized repeat protein (TIGR02543 family)